jgi:hypothetical protein
MNRRVVFIISILITVSSYGQTTKKEKKFHSEIKFGVEAGLNIPKILYSGINGTKPTGLFAIAWHVGGYASISMSDKLSFQPELLYSMKGDRVLNPFTGSKYFIYRFGYIEIPLQLNFNLSEHFALVGGLYIGYLTTFSTNVNNTTYSNSSNISYYDTFNKLDIGVTIGIAYELKNGFNMAIKYSQGFSNMVHAQDSNGSPIVPEYNMVFSLCLGWTFK